MSKKNTVNSSLEGKKAPSFKILDDKNKQVSLGDFSGEYLLIFFYPKDLTPGCTIEAKSFRDNMSKLKKLGLNIIGISSDDIDRHCAFRDKHELNFPLLADINKEAVAKYGVWVEKNMYGKKYMGIQRDSFLIGPDGKIIKHYIKVKPDKHVEEVMSDFKALKS